jgi:hypothetical protein
MDDNNAMAAATIVILNRNLLREVTFLITVSDMNPDLISIHNNKEVACLWY